MLLELSEVLACPRCGPPLGLVAIVDRPAGRRIVRGVLGCPRCESRFPVRDGVAWLIPDVEAGEIAAADATPHPEAGPGGRAPSRVGSDDRSRLPSDAATVVAALLELQRPGGSVLLLPSLAAAASALARLAEGVEPVVLLERRRGATGGPGAGSRLRISGSRIPLLDGRMRAAALTGVETDALPEVARVVARGGRVAVLRPDGSTPSRATEAGLSVVAESERALLARRS